MRILSLVNRLRSLLNWEIGLYVLLAIMAAGMRLWELGERAFHYDESLHAFFSWKLYAGQGYEHMAMMHGPFQFHGTALNFLLFGDSDFTARLLPVIFGTALVVLPYFLRRQLGRWGSLAVATLLAFSPMLLYFSRYVRNDIYILFWTLLLVICLWRYFEEKKARYLYIGAAALSLSFCTKEVSYITVAIFASFLLIVAAPELVAAVRRRFKLSALSPGGEYLILIGTLSLPLGAALGGLIPGVDQYLWPKVLIVVFLFIISAAIGLRWNARRWLWSVLIFYGIFALLYTSFFTNISGFGSGIWDSLAYWIEQHGVERGDQPWYYYLVLIPTYEFLPLVFASVGAVYYAVRGNLFSRFLVYWAVLSLILYSWSGEKMPWLSLHMILPLILLGGMFIGRLLQAFDWRRARAWALRGVSIAALLLLFSFSVHVALEASYNVRDEPPQMLIYAGMSYDMTQIMDQIEELAAETGEGEELKITVDYPLYWDWVWYLRNYDIDYPDLSHIDQPPRGSVLLLLAGHEQSAEPYLEKYGQGQRFHQRLWFPEEYKEEYGGFDLGWWWDYFLNRKTLSPYWSTEGIAYFPKGVP